MQDNHFSYKNCYQHGSCVKLKKPTSNNKLNDYIKVKKQNKTGCHAVEKMTRNSEALELDVAIRLLFFLVSARFCLDTDVGYLKISLIVIQSTLINNYSSSPNGLLTQRP